MYTISCKASYSVFVVVPVCRCYPSTAVDMLPTTEVSQALEASGGGLVLLPGGLRALLPPHAFTDMDSATRHHLGLGNGPSSVEVEELMEDSRLVSSTLLIPIILNPLLTLLILLQFFSLIFLAVLHFISIL